MLRNVRIMPCVSYGRRKRGKDDVRGLVKVIGSLTASLGLHTDRYCAQWSAFGSVCVCVG